jgi:adenylate kinase family enzyme
MSENYILNIYGPSTAGKSTLAELLQSSIQRVYTVDYDVIKRQIAGYDHKTDKQVATDLTYEFLASVAKTDLPILSLLPPPPDESAYRKIEHIAETCNRQLINVEITAPEEVLVARYEDRLRQVRESGSQWKFRTIEEFKDGISKPYYRADDTITFDSSLLLPKEILAKVQSLLWN